MPSERIPLQSSYRELPPDFKIVPSISDETVEVTVVVRRRAQLPAATSPSARLLSREEFADRYGADPADLERIEAFARAEHLAVVRRDIGTRSVVLAGVVAQMEQAFAVTLVTVQRGDQRFRVATGMIYIPIELRDVVEAVLGLDNRPAADPH